MTAEFDQFIEDARRQATYEAERFPDDDWPPIVLALLKAIDERDEQARGLRFRIEVACGGYAHLMDEDVPSGMDLASFEEGAAEAARAILAVAYPSASKGGQSDA